MGPEFVKELSELPAALRKQMLKGRMDQLLALPEEGRQEAIRGLAAGFLDPKVKESVREELIATRTEIIGELSEDRRRTIMMSVMQALKDDPDSAKANRDVVEKILPKVPSEARAAFMETMKSLSGPPQG